MKRLLMSLVLMGVLCVSPYQVQAIVNPLATPNNRFGIHITDQNDLDAAVKLINSSGGDWGYVTLVIRSDDRKPDKWQPIFDRLRVLHLIPLVRLSTVSQGDMWQKPTASEIPAWVEFLNGLNWVVKNRYVILYNEPNHAAEWGGDVKPNEYASIAREFADALHAASPDYFVLPAGLDAAAPNGRDTMSMSQYLKFMHAADQNIFNCFDGWTSHAYPNPNFSGSIHDRGAQSLVSYRTELALLANLDLKKSLPVFITETGWVHTEGVSPQYGTYPAAKVADLIVNAFKTVWQDTNIVAITPFMLNYPVPPFDHFSWTKPGGNDYYPQYQAVMDLPKISGQPTQIDASRFATANLPAMLVNLSVYEIPLSFMNIGQTIWSPGLYEMVVDGDLVGNRQMRLAIPETMPFTGTTGTIHLETPRLNGKYTLNVRVEREHQPVGELAEREIKVISPPNLTLTAPIGYWEKPRANDAKLLIYDGDQVVKTVSPLAITQGTGAVNELRDIVPNRSYRFVLLKPYYLPRQTIALLSTQSTQITFAKLLPFDLNRDGRFSLIDVWSALTHPRLMISLL